MRRLALLSVLLSVSTVASAQPASPELLISNQISDDNRQLMDIAKKCFSRWGDSTKAMMRTVTDENIQFFEVATEAHNKQVSNPLLVSEGNRLHKRNASVIYYFGDC
jgi:hypothetical protein